MKVKKVARDNYKKLKGIIRDFLDRLYTGVVISAAFVFVPGIMNKYLDIQSIL